MTKYSVRALDVDAAIPQIQERIKEPTTPNTVKLGFSMMIEKLKDSKKCQKSNIHRQIGWAECSCGLQVEAHDEESFDTVSERLFRSRGHVDHVSGQLTKFFVRMWQKRDSASLFCWWCLQCGYLGEINVGASRRVRAVPDHQCESDRVKQELLAELKGCLIKPGIRPVVAGADSWNAAISKAISLLGD